MPDIQNIPTTQYIGPRIIPHLWDPILWDADTQYDALAIVQYNGVPYIARYVPPQGTLPTNTEYWVRWADFNAQMAQLQQTVESFDNRITTNATDIDTLESIVPRSAFSSTNTVRKAINDEVTARQQAVSAEASARQQAISAEETARQQAVSAEASARQQAISAEETARENADSAIRALLPASSFSSSNTVASQLASVRSDLTALQNSVDLAAIRKECVLMLGDSYAQGEHAESATSHNGPNWQQYLIDSFGFTDTYLYKGGGGGFVATSTSTSGSASTVPTGTTYNEILNYAYNYINGLGRASEVKHIIIQGGVNDGSWLANGQTTESGIRTAIGTCLTNLRGHFPNAKVYVVYVACGHTSWQKTSARKISIPALFNTAATNGGAAYGQCTNLPWCYGNDAASHDGSHPTSAMQRLIAGYIAKLMLGDDKDYTTTFNVAAGTHNNAFVAQVTSDHHLIFPVGDAINFSTSGGVPFNDGTTAQPDLVAANPQLEAMNNRLCMPMVYYNGGVSFIGQFEFSANGRVKWIQRDQGATATTRDYITSLACRIDTRIG